MIINKITAGFVTQKFDTKKMKFVSQEFFAGDNCDYEYENEEGEMGKIANDKDIEKVDTTYLPYDMVQPKMKKD